MHLCWEDRDFFQQNGGVIMIAITPKGLSKILTEITIGPIPGLKNQLQSVKSTIVSQMWVQWLLYMKLALALWIWYRGHDIHKLNCFSLENALNHCKSHDKSLSYSEKNNSSTVKIDSLDR